MTDRTSTAFWIEAVLSGVSGFLVLLTLAWRDWIEAVFGWDPDHHNGSLEWLLVAALLLCTVTFGRLARVEWRRIRAIRAPGGSV